MKIDLNNEELELVLDALNTAQDDAQFNAKNTTDTEHYLNYYKELKRVYNKIVALQKSGRNESISLDSMLKNRDKIFKTSFEKLVEMGKKIEYK